MPHSPAPWEVNHAPADDETLGMITVDVAGANLDAICEVLGEESHLDYERSHDEAMANARLIAAAPAMLAALQAIVADGSGASMHSEVWALVRGAIAAATP